MIAQSLLFSLALASPALAQWWRPAPSCPSTPEYVGTLQSGFSLKIVGSQFNGQLVSVSEEGAGEIRFVIGDEGYQTNLTLKDWHLYGWGGAVSAAPSWVESSQYLYEAGFEFEPENPIEFVAKKSCAADGRSTKYEIIPGEQTPETAPLGFCITWASGKAQIALKFEDRPEDWCDPITLEVGPGLEEGEEDDGDWWPAPTTTTPWWGGQPTTRPVTVTVTKVTTRRTSTQWQGQPTQNLGRPTRTVIAPTTRRPNNPRPTTQWGGNNGGGPLVLPPQGGGGGGGNGGGVIRTVILNP